MIKRLRPLVFILLGLVCGYFLSHGMISKDNPIKNVKAEKKILYWVAPMDPSYRRNKPGKSPMGMDLVPVYEKNKGASRPAKNAVHIEPQVIDNLGVISEPAKVMRVKQQINAIGYVQADENNIESINVYIDGWIKKLNINSVGDKVKKGQVLFTLYSPSLILAEEEYMLAVKNNNSALILAGEKKLMTLGLNSEQIKNIRQRQKVISFVRVFARNDGIVSMLNIREGMYVTANTKLMVIENLASIWVKVSILEKMASLIKPGLNATASFSGLGAKIYSGKVQYVYPTLDKKTHTLSARLIFKNRDLTLKPNMYADVMISVPQEKARLMIPESAVIFLGEGAHVIKDLGKGYFKAVPVKVGKSASGRRVILSGLKENDRVVTYSQFLIDSESSLKAAFQRLSPLPKKTNIAKIPHHNHQQIKKAKMGHDMMEKGSNRGSK